MTLCEPMDCSPPGPCWLLCLWDSPGKNTGVGSHALLQRIFPTQGLNLCLSHVLHWQMDSLPLTPPGLSLYIFTIFDSLQPQGLYSPWNSPGQNTGVGSLSLLQGIFPTQEESNRGFLHCRWILYQQNYQGSP